MPDHRTHPRLRFRNVVNQIARIPLHEADRATFAHLGGLHANHPPQKPLDVLQVTSTGLVPMPRQEMVSRDPWGREALAYAVDAILAPGSLFVAVERVEKPRIYHGLVVEDPAAAGELPLQGGDGVRVLACLRLAPATYKAYVRALAAPDVNPAALMPVRGGSVGKGAGAVSAANNVLAPGVPTGLGADLKALVRLGGDPAAVAQAYALGFLKAATFLRARQ